MGPSQSRPLSSPIRGPRHASWTYEEPHHLPPADITAILRDVVQMARAFYSPPIRVQRCVHPRPQGSGLCCARGDVVWGPLPQTPRRSPPHRWSMPPSSRRETSRSPTRSAPPFRTAARHMHRQPHLLLWPCHGRSTQAEYFRKTRNIRRRPSPRHQAGNRIMIQGGAIDDAEDHGGGGGWCSLCPTRSYLRVGVMTRMQKFSQPH